MEYHEGFERCSFPPLENLDVFCWPPLNAGGKIRWKTHIKSEKIFISGAWNPNVPCFDWSLGLLLESQKQGTNR